MSNITIEDKLSFYAFAQPEPKYFEAMPGFIDYLTYIEHDYKTVKTESGQHKEMLFDEDGQPIYVRKRLKPIHKDIYRVMKKLAGEEVCMRTEKYIARMVGCSTHTVSEAKEVFQNAFEQTDGMPLLLVDEQRCLTKKIEDDGTEKKINKRPVHITHIMPIWRYNNPFMKIIYGMHASDERRLPPEMKERISIKEAEVCIEKMAQPGIQDTVHNCGAERKYASSPKAERKYALSPQEEKEGRTQICVRHKHPLQNPFVLKQDPAEKAIQLSLINQNNVEECFVSQHKATEFLEVFGLKQKDIFNLFTRHNLHELLSSVFYLQKMIAKKKEISSLTGYYLKTLKGKWYLPKAS